MIFFASASPALAAGVNSLRALAKCLVLKVLTPVPVSATAAGLIKRAVMVRTISFLKFCILRFPLADAGITQQNARHAAKAHDGRIEVKTVSTVNLPKNQVYLWLIRLIFVFRRHSWLPKDVFPTKIVRLAGQDEQEV